MKQILNTLAEKFTLVVKPVNHILRAGKVYLTFGEMIPDARQQVNHHIVLPFQDNLDAYVHKSEAILEEDKEHQHQYELSVQTKLLEQMVNSNCPVQKRVFGRQLLNTFEKALRPPAEDHDVLLANSIGFEDTDLDFETVCEMALTAMELTKKSAEKTATYFKARNAMQRTIEEYLTPDLLPREESLAMIKELVSSHTVDDHKNKLLAGKKQFINGVYYS